MKTSLMHAMKEFEPKVYATIGLNAHQYCYEKFLKTVNNNLL